MADRQGGQLPSLSVFLCPRRLCGRILQEAAECDIKKRNSAILRLGGHRMITEKRKTKLLVVLIILLLAAIAGAVVYGLTRPGRTELPVVTPRPTAQVVVKEREVEKIVEKEKEITASILQEGLSDMGLLVTEEYYFTEVVNYSSVKKYWKIELKFTESSFLASYDGLVTAGVDLSGVKLQKEENPARIVVTMPKAEIQNVDIDPNSFRLYSEKEGFGNRISVEEYNNSLVELENAARDRAVERGVLERADENAKLLVRNFIGSLVDLSLYAVEFVTAD